MDIARLLKFSAIATVLATPAFAQDASLGSILNPQIILGTNTQTGTLNATATAVGVMATAITSQSNFNNLNQVGGTPLTGSTVTPLYSGDLNIGIGQVVGDIPFSGSNTASFTQSTTNAIQANSTNSSGFMANVLAGGNQNAVSGVNTAAVGLINGAALTLQQAQNGGGASSQASTNNITAFGISGNSAVNGYGGAQNAQSALNVASLSVGATTSSSGATVPGSVSVALDQMQKGAAVNQTAQNTAAAGVVSGINPVIDPSVSNLTQNAGISMNTFAATGGNVALSNGPSGIDPVSGLPVGGQNSGTNGTGTLQLSNQALAATGSTLAGTTAGTIPTSGSTGIASVTGIRQNASLALNTATNSGGNLTLGNGVSPFTQNVDAAYAAASGLSSQTIQGVAAAQTNVVNSQVAQTGSGNATVTGTLAAPSQYAAQNLNSVGALGVVSGSLVQTAGTQDLTSGVGSGITGSQMTNVAAASTLYGGAKVADIGQVQNNTVNTVAGAAGVGLTLQQAAAGVAGAVTAGGINNQFASASGGAATISGAGQSLNAGVNVANIGGVLGGTGSQVAKNITTDNQNTLKATGGSSVVTGSQVATSGVNVIR